MILINGIPVLGSFPISNKIPATEGTQFLALTDNWCNFLFGHNTDLVAWHKKMAERVWDWVPRFYGGYGTWYDRQKQYNNALKMERRGLEEFVYAPMGLVTPGDGWVIYPAFSGNRYTGQMVCGAKGLKFRNDIFCPQFMRYAEFELTGENFLVEDYPAYNPTT